MITISCFSYCLTGITVTQRCYAALVTPGSQTTKGDCLHALVVWTLIVQSQAQAVMQCRLVLAILGVQYAGVPLLVTEFQWHIVGIMTPVLSYQVLWVL